MGTFICQIYQENVPQETCSIKMKSWQGSAYFLPLFLLFLVSYSIRNTLTIDTFWNSYIDHCFIGHSLVGHSCIFNNKHFYLVLDLVSSYRLIVQKLFILVKVNTMWMFLWHNTRNIIVVASRNVIKLFFYIEIFDLKERLPKQLYVSIAF